MEDAREAIDLVIEPANFWFIWTKTGRFPKFTHDTEDGALAEANRLARLRPGKKFIVLRATHKLHTVPSLDAKTSRDLRAAAETFLDAMAAPVDPSPSEPIEGA